MTSEANIMRMWQRLYFTAPHFIRAPYGIQIPHKMMEAAFISDAGRRVLVTPMVELVEPIETAGLSI